MFQIDINKFKVSVKSYTYEEFEKNKVILVNKVCVFYFLYFIVASCVFSSLFGGFWVGLVGSLLVAFFISVVQLQDEISGLKNKYFYGAKRKWIVCTTIIISPRFRMVVDEKRLDDFRYLNLLNDCRRDVGINNGKIEYYITLSDGKLKRRSAPVESVLIDVNGNEVSYFIREHNCFVDERFQELFEKKLLRSNGFTRTVIKSKFIQW